MDTSAKILTHPLTLRLAWQVAPSTVICVLFWLAALRLWVQDYRHLDLRWSRVFCIVSGIGLVMNTAVTLVNGGYMPVVGDVQGFSVWMRSTEAHRLLWLADRFEWQGFIYSLGDVVIAVGGLARFAYWIGRGIWTVISVEIWAFRDQMERRRRVALSLRHQAESSAQS